MAALTSKPESIPGCAVERLGVLRYRVVASCAYLDRYFPDYPAVSAKQLSLAPVVEFDRKDFGLASAQELLLDRFGLGKQTLLTPPIIYLPSSPDYVRAVLSGIAWGIIPEVQCARELESGELVELAQEPVDVPLYWQYWKISSPVLERLSERVYSAASREGVLR